jgi:hypothetical protein
MRCESKFRNNEQTGQSCQSKSGARNETGRLAIDVDQMGRPITIAGGKPIKATSSLKRTCEHVG